MDAQTFYVYSKPHAIAQAVAHRVGTKVFPRKDLNEKINRQLHVLVSCHCNGWPFPREGRDMGGLIRTEPIDRFRCSALDEVGSLSP